MKEKLPRIRLHDIAQACGCSINTVSFALNNNPRVAASMRQRILKTAAEMGYVPNSLASALRSGRTHMVAVAVDGLQNPHYTGNINRIEALLNQRRYHIITLITRGEDQSAGEMIRTALSLSVDGIIYYPRSIEDPLVDTIRESGTPYILLDCRQSGAFANTVCTDDMAGGRLAGETMLSLGHRKLLYMAGPAGCSAQIDRQAGLTQAIEAAELSAECLRVIPWEQAHSAAENGGLWELLQPIDFTAIISFNDELGYYLRNELTSHGLRIPEDISILGFERNHRFVEYLPSLSSVAETDELDTAKCAVSILLQQIENPPTPTVLAMLPVALFDEGTIGPPPATGG